MNPETEKVPTPETGASGQINRWRWPGWIGYAAAAWSLIYGALGLYWALGGAGFPFGREKDPDAALLSVLGGAGENLRSGYRRAGPGRRGDGAGDGPETGKRNDPLGADRVRLNLRRGAGAGDPGLPRAGGLAYAPIVLVLQRPGRCSKTTRRRCSRTSSARVKAP